MSEQNKILILVAHPVLHKSRVNNIILAAINDLPGVTINNLYENYPNFHIDVKHEQQLLLEHDIIIWQHPFYWYSAPAIVKEWMDLVLEHGFAYGRNGKALSGKYIFNAISAGGRREAYTEGGYNHYTINQLLVPFEQTARLCNMTYLPPFVIHGTHLLAENEISTYAQNYLNILVSLRDGIFSDSEILQFSYLNELLELNEKK